METSIGSDIARTVFAQIDKVIYYLITAIYNIIDDLAKNVSIFDEATVDNFASRIYVFIGLIMVFKVTFSLINYLVNPDAMNDKNNGVGNIAKNIVVTLVLIIVTPFVFDFMYQAQSAILNDNILPQVILGSKDGHLGGQNFRMDEQCPVKQVDDPGKFMALVTLRPFYSVNPGASVSSIADEYCNENYTAGDLLTSDIYKAEDGDNYIIDYSYFLSTVTGAIVLILMLTIGMDIALRIIKLGFLEIIAPIPIISYIDPKQGKDGIFKKWFKEVWKTWLTLFVKLSVLYFAIYIMSVLNDTITNIDHQEYGVWVELFVLIGALMFAKQFTKLVEDIFGFKMDTLSLHPIKKIQDQAMFGKQITDLGSGAIGAAGGAIAGAKAGAAAGALGRGITMGAFTGFSNGKGDKKPFSTGMSKTYKHMTGNEMFTLTPSQVIMGLGKKGENRVGQVKDALKIANERLRNEETRLNNAAYLSSRASEVLNRYKIDPNKMKSSKEYNDEATLLENQTQRLVSQFENDTKTYNDAKAFVESYKPINGMDGKPIYSDKYKEMKKLVDDYDSSDRLTNMQNTINNNRRTIDEKRDIAKAVTNYQTSMKAQQDARAAIADINREISTLSDEKKQRETFWQVDTSPKEKVDKALAANQPPVKNGIDLGGASNSQTTEDGSQK